eukprot:TRINITY_DN2397_c0_g1_i1.p1 TRINITY_DN2397_c0_g1~~TRINITY_DN2397_c0_g1_i1.p1  ORF type:complete len:175 (+),score=30.93 TRINITY_DN2397_c0_g1_i1:116-640(+)
MPPIQEQDPVVASLERNLNWRIMIRLGWNIAYVRSATERMKEEEKRRLLAARKKQEEAKRLEQVVAQLTKNLNRIPTQQEINVGLDKERERRLEIKKKELIRRQTREMERKEAVRNHCRKSGRDPTPKEFEDGLAKFLAKIQQQNMNRRMALQLEKKDTSRKHWMLCNYSLAVE